MTDDKSDDKASEGTPLAKAAERIRGSSQWLLGAFAAVGAVLAAGLQLADIGSLTTDDPLRLLLGMGGILVAVVGIIVAITNAATVSTKSDVSLQWLLNNTDSEAAKAVAGDSALLQGMSIATLQGDLNNAVTAAKATFDEILQLGDPGADPALKAQAKTLNDRYKVETARLSNLRAVRADVLDVASFNRVKGAYTDAKRGMLVGAILTAAGITMFAWGANAPTHTKIDGGSVLPRTPSEVTVILTDAGKEKFGDALGAATKDGCDTTAVAGIAFDVTKTAYHVVSVRTDKCNVVSMDVTDDLGKVIPRVSAEDSKDQTATTQT